VTQPEWPSRVPRRTSCSAMVTVVAAAEDGLTWLRKKFSDEKVSVTEM
jgi:hypothetical protein